MKASIADEVTSSTQLLILEEISSQSWFLSTDWICKRLEMV